jgi:hypothetical protein
MNTNSEFDLDHLTHIINDMEAHECELVQLCHDGGPINTEDVAAIFRTLRRHRLQLETLKPFPPIPDPENPQNL